ncbi:oxidoreductase [Hyalangium versicolor]|uniref:oxidoreductase n=1 Tax=Hyalangium versicolor TaxID=2861190 RepID=UPI001CC973BB|nr:oxidoreductase [Hyalangium versicolor]
MSTLQTPLGSGFGPASTTADVIKGVSLEGKIAVVTGGYAGLGLETARILASAGARVIVPARDLQKAAAALNGLEGVELEPMDLIDPGSIDTFARKFLDSGRPLHILVNNAGVMALPQLKRDARGVEHHFAINHLGHFQLALRLLPALRRAKGARVVSLSSRGHQRSDVVFDDLNFERREYQPMLAYGQSKTANILFAVGLDARESARGVRAFSVHPGSIVATDLGRYLSTEQLRALGVIDENGRPILDPERQLKTVEQGAATQVWCATSPRLEGMGGVYCENVEVARLVSTEGSSGVRPYAIDPRSADRLWELSEGLLG